MTWFTRFTRFGEMHMVYSQENSDSCGIASVRMIVFKVNKFKPSATALRSEQSIDAEYSGITKTKYDGSVYSDGMVLFKLLNRFIGAGWVCEFVGVNAIGQKLIDRIGVSGTPEAATGLPVILHVGWSTSGAHFVVADSVNKVGEKYYASICDPWDGNVHVTEFTPGQAFGYTGAPVPWSWSLGAPEHNYDAGSSSGAASGWMIFKK